MREKKLRPAMVCYGGISLAVYMHGLNKEIWRLALANRDFHHAGSRLGAEGRPELADLTGLPGRRPDILMRFGHGAVLPFLARRSVRAVLA